MQWQQLLLIMLTLPFACKSPKFQEGGTVKSLPQAADSDQNPKEEIPKEQNSGKSEVAAPTIQTGKSLPKPSTEATTAVDGALETNAGIEFGSEQVFRIGDGQAPDSSCLQELATFNLSGTAYFFEFRVLEDATQITLSLGKLCGVDYAESNSVALADRSSNIILQRKLLPQKLINASDPSLSPFAPILLSKGLYAIVVRSEASFQKSPDFAEPYKDYDDFLVGKINIKANKPVKAVRIFAEDL